MTGVELDNMTFEEEESYCTELLKNIHDKRTFIPPKEADVVIINLGKGQKEAILWYETMLGIYNNTKDKGDLRVLNYLNTILKQHVEPSNRFIQRSDAKDPLTPIRQTIHDRLNT